MIPVHLIGLGMSAADLTPKAWQLIEAAEVLAGGRRHLDLVPAQAGQQIVIGRDVAGALQAIKEAAATRRVVVLASGDPYFYGIGRRLTEFLGGDNVVVHPNITAVQSAAALVKIPWDDATVVSLHGRGAEHLTGVLGRAAKIIVYTAGAQGPGEVARLLLNAGISHYRLGVVENLGEATQRLTWLNPAEAAGRSFADLNLVVLLAEPGELAPRLHLGLPEADLEHEAGLITKSEIRAVVLAKLRLLPGQVVWDVGAGCGSVGLEAGLLVPGGRVFAIERQPERVRQITANKRHFRAMNLEVICGEAPDCLAGLPWPDRVFIGGGGTRLTEIIETVLTQIKPKGRLILTATLLATWHTALAVLEARGWEAEVCQVQISRGRPLAGSVYLQALNPVWIIAAEAKEP